MTEETIVIEVTDEDLDAAIEKADRALEGTQSVDEVVDEILAKERDVPDRLDLEGIAYAQRRIIAMIPGVREAYGLVQQMQALLDLSPSVAALLVSVMLLRSVIEYFRRQEERMRDLEDLVKRYRGFATRREARDFLDEQTRLVRQSYQGAAP